MIEKVGKVPSLIFLVLETAMRKCGILALLIGAGGFCLLLAVRPTPVTPRLYSKHFEQIQNGMDETQVSAILGCPPGNYTGRHMKPLFGEPRQRSGSVRVWEGEVYIFYVWFEDGIVTDKFMDFSTREEDFLEKARRWFRY
jgi:hypothetical protein